MKKFKNPLIQFSFICIALLPTDIAKKQLYRNPDVDLHP